MEILVRTCRLLSELLFSFEDFAWTFFRFQRQMLRVGHWIQLFWNIGRLFVNILVKPFQSIYMMDHVAFLRVLLRGDHLHRAQTGVYERWFLWEARIRRAPPIVETRVWLHWVSQLLVSTVLCSFLLFGPTLLHEKIHMGLYHVIGGVKWRLVGHVSAQLCDWFYFRYKNFFYLFQLNSLFGDPWCFYRNKIGKYLVKLRG